MKLTELTNSNLQSLGKEIDAALAGLKEKYGLKTLRVNGGTRGVGQATLKLEIAVDKGEADKDTLIRNLAAFDIPAEAYMKQCLYKGRQWVITNVHMQKDKYNIEMTDSNGKISLFTPYHVKSLMFPGTLTFRPLTKS